jgi:hypothetical protein
LRADQASPFGPSRSSRLSRESRVTVPGRAQWVERVCHSGRKRSALQQEQTPDPFYRREVKPMPQRLPYGVKEKSWLVASPPEISTGERDDLVA